MLEVVMQQHVETIRNNLHLVKPYTATDNITIVRILLNGELCEASKDWMRKTFGIGLAADLVAKLDSDAKNVALSKAWALAEAIDSIACDLDPEHYINIALGGK